MERKWVKLASEHGQHYDRELGFHIRPGEIKQLPEVVPAGSLTAQRLDTRSLIYADPPADASLTPSLSREGRGSEKDPDVSPAAPAESADPGAVAHEAEMQEDRQDAGAAASLPTTPEALAAARDIVIERRVETLKQENTVAQLRARAKRLGLNVKSRTSEHNIAVQIAVAEWQREHEKRKK